jgi:HEAT repeat protein
VRRAAARRLGELGAVEAVPKLRELAKAQRQVRGFWGTKSEPICGSSDAAATVRRIEAMAGRRP